MNKKNIAISLNKNVVLAAKEIKKQFSDITNIKCIMFFASHLYDPNALASAMAEQFPDIGWFGATSNKEISPEGVHMGSLVAFAFTSDIIEDYHLEVVENLSSDSLDMEPILNKFVAHYNRPLRDLESDKYFGLIFIDFQSKSEEKLFNEISDSVNMVFLGATASDDWEFKKTGIYANGKYYRDAAIIGLFKSKRKFAFEKIESVEEVATPLLVTKSDLHSKILYEIDGRPAAEVYCEMNNLNYETLNKDAKSSAIDGICRKHPLGIKIDEQVYLRDVSHADEKNKSLVMVCNIPEGMEVHFYRVVDGVLANTKPQMKALHKKYNNKIDYCLTFSCSNRLEDIKKEGNATDFYDLLTELSSIGFYTFGEYYTVPVNHTSTYLILLDE